MMQVPDLSDDEIILGIDPGLSGGIAVVTTQGYMCAVSKLPTIEIVSQRKKKRELDIRPLVDYIVTTLCGQKKLHPVACYVESVHAMPGQGVTSMFTFGMGFGMLRGMLATLDIRTIMVSPVTWKRAVLADSKHDKKGTIAYCQTKYKHLSMVPPGSRKPQDGMADAICIAEYGFITHSKPRE